MVECSTLPLTFVKSVYFSSFLFNPKLFYQHVLKSRWGFVDAAQHTFICTYGWPQSQGGLLTWAQLKALLLIIISKLQPLQKIMIIKLQMHQLLLSHEC
jgi:hypothetical protein